MKKTKFTTYHNDYLYSVDTSNIDNKLLVDQCLFIEKYLLNDLPVIDTHRYGCLTTAHHLEYNFLTSPLNEINKLYHTLKKHLKPFLEKDTNYMIKSWLNVFRENQKIDWHGHWPHEFRVWHGFYCLQVGTSCTYYKIPNHSEIIKVPSVDGRIVFGKSQGDEHCSSTWTDNSIPRITIAFDIIPVDSLKNIYRINHYIPFV